MPNRSIRTETLEPVHWAVIGLATISGLVHLGLGIMYIEDILGISFLMAGIGFAVGIGCILIDYRRRLVFILGIPFVGAQIISWIVIAQPTLGTVSPVEIADKLAQVTLIILLVYLLVRD